MVKKILRIFYSQDLSVFTVVVVVEIEESVVAVGFVGQVVLD